MKIIGRTEDRAFIVVIPMEEMIKLMGASQTLNNFISNQIMVPTAPADQPAEPVARHTSPDRSRRKVARPARKKIYGHRHARSNNKDREASGRLKTAGQTHLCKWCKKPLPANASPLRKYHAGECEKLIKRKWARDAFRKKHGVKNPRKFKAKAVDCGQSTVLPSGNPADPGLTDEQRQKLRQNREEMLKTINERIDARQN